MRMTPSHTPERRPLRARLLREPHAGFTLLLICVLLLAAFPRYTYALSSGDVTFTLVTPFLALDSNNSCSAGPLSSYIEIKVTNPVGGAGTLTNLSASLSAFAGTAGVTLDAGESGTRYIGTLADGASFPLYFYVNYACQSGSPAANTSTFTATVTDGVAPVTSGTLTLTDRSELSANAGGQVTSSTIGPGAILGQIIPMTVNYDFGNPGGAQLAMIQPAGNASFDAGCFRLMSVDITAVTGFSAGLTTSADDQLYFTGVNGASSNTATVVYYFKMMCAGASTTANPFSDLTSGGQLKYTGNFGTCSATGAICPAYPAPTNPFTITKSASPASLPTGGTATYTVVISNPSAYAGKLESITDVLPAGVSFGAITGASQVTAANSSSVPANGATGTIVFNGVPTTSCVGGTCNGSWYIAAGGSLTLVYTVSVPNTAGTYTNSASTTIGSTSIGPATASVAVGSADIQVGKSVSSATANVGTNVTFTITAKNNGSSAASGVVVTDLLPAGLTYVSSTPSQGTYTSGTGAWAVGSLANGATATLTVVATVTQAGAIVNSASVTGSNLPDPTPGNNSASATVTGQSADLAVTKSVSSATPNVGSDVTYTVQVTNNGPSAATGVKVTDLLPAGMSLVSSNPSQGTYTSGTGLWSVGSLANGASATLTIVATVTQAGTITNVASVSASDQTDPNSANNSSSRPLDGQQADLAVAKSVSNATPNVGTDVTFTVQVSNSGPSTATGVVVSDLLPAGLTFVSSSAGQGSYASGSGLWSVGSLASGASATLTVVATVAQPGAIVNTASVAAANQPDPNAGNNSASATVTGQQADLAVTKTVSDSAPNVGTDVTFTVKVTNNGPSTATGVAIGDALPAGLALVSSNPSQGTYSAGSWAVGSLASGASATLTVVATVTQPTAITNVASVTASSQPDPNSANNSASATVTGQQADLAIAKTVDNPGATQGDTVVYTIQVTNNGPSAATSVVVHDPMPSGAAYVSDSTATGSYSSATGDWSIPSLANGASATLQITAQITALGTVTNVAAITGADQPDPDPSDNSDSVSTPTSVADIGVAKGVDVAAPNVGADVTFTITAQNNGPSAATGVVVSDLLPAGLSFVSASTATGSYSSGTGAWAIGGLANGASATLTIVATVTQPGAITNSAVVTGLDQTDPNLANDNASVVVTGQAADLAVTKTASDATPNVGSNVTFTITVANGGPSNATGVKVTDLLPAGLSFVSASTAAGSYSAGVWSVGTLANGASATLTIVATVTQPGAITNTASATADQPDPSAGNSSASATVTGQQADLAVTKTASDATPNVGTDVTYTITVANGGPSTATGVVVSDLLPASLTLVSSSAGQGSYDSGTGVWSVGTLANGASATLTVVATVTQPGPVANTASVTGADQPDPTPGNDSASATVTGQQADLAVTKAAGAATPNVGANVTFTITAKNNGPSTATGVAVTDLLPAGLSFVSASTAAGSYSSGTGVWSVGSLANGASATLTVVATVTQPGAITNSASVTGLDQPDPNAANDSGSATVTGQQADLAVTKTVSSATPNVGTNVTFTVTVANSGPSAATNVVVGDALPAGLTLVSSNPSQGSYSAGSWSVGSLANGASATLDIVATVTQPGAITNTASVTGADQPDPTPGNDSSSASVGGQQADLAVTKTVSSATPNVGADVAFTVQVTNGGPSAATGVVIGDALPAGLTLVSATPSQGSYSAGSWSVGGLANGATASLTIVATVTQAGAITNVASVTASNQPDPNGANNSDGATVTGQQADLSVTKSVSAATPNVGTNVTFTVTVANGGPSAATNVVVGDALPAGLTFVSASTAAGSYSSGTGLWSVGSLASGASATLDIVATVTQPGAITNTASVTGADQPDPTPGNDSGSATVTGQQADLAVTKSVDDATPSVGADVTFTVLVSNNGPSTATGVRVDDLLPAGLSFVSATAGQGSYVSATGVWTVGTIASGGSATLTVVATATQAGAVTNTAAVGASDQPDPNAANDSASVTVTGQQADLAVTKSVDNATPNVGSNVTFTVQVTNGGPSAASGVAISDVLPAGLTLVSSSASQGSYSAGVWTVGALASGASATLDIVATVTQAGTVTNVASVSASSVPDPNAANDSGSSSVGGQVADLAVTKTVDNATPNVGSNVTFTVQVTNGGPSGATGVAVTDLLPAGLTLVSASTATGSYSAGVWSVGSLANGASATLTVVATVTQPGAIVNTASITAAGQPDPSSANNSASATVTGQQADLAVTKSVDSAAPNVGASVTFTVQVTNNGPSAATNVTVGDLLPAGLAYVSSSPSQGSYASGTGAWSVGSLANGASASIDIVATVTQAGTITNVASVTGADQPDPNAANDSASVSVGGQAVDLAVAKTVSNASPGANASVTYTVQVTNGGPSGATGVVLADVLPAGLTLTSATPSQGSYSSGTGLWSVGSLASGVSASLTVVATVAQPGTIVNTASVSKVDQPDTNSANDSASATLSGQVADLSVTKAADKSTAAVGDPVAYTVTVHNSGPSGATNVSVSDKLPAGLIYVADTPSQGSYSSATGVWSVGALASGASATLVIQTTVGGTGSLVNIAQVQAADQFDPNSTPGNGAPGENDQSSAAISAAPTAIALASFTAQQEGQGIAVRWATTSERDTWGFLIYRSADGDRGHAVRVTPEIILGSGRSGGGAYEWVDTDVRPGQAYSYWLVEVELSSATHDYGPVSSRPGRSSAGYQVALPLVVR